VFFLKKGGSTGRMPSESVVSGLLAMAPGYSLYLCSLRQRLNFRRIMASYICWRTVPRGDPRSLRCAKQASRNDLTIHNEERPDRFEHQLAVALFIVTAPRLKSTD
jgi:hypothetical protein